MGMTFSAGLKPGNKTKNKFAHRIERALEKNKMNLIREADER
jgi:hypothetical protein